MYSSPLQLINHRRLPLGTRQSGRRVHHVLLPPWSRGAASSFVRELRRTLDGECAAAIGGWVDLVWGWKQRGEAAVEAHNVYPADVYAEEGADRRCVRDMVRG